MFECKLCEGTVPQEGLCEDCGCAMAYLEKNINYPNTQELVRQLGILQQHLSDESRQTVSFSLAAAVLVHNVALAEDLKRFIKGGSGHGEI